MNSPLWRLLRISLTSVFLLFFLIFLLRWAGLSTLYSSMDHPLLKETFLVITEGASSSQAPPQTLASLKAAYDLSPKILLKINLQLTQDQHWVLYSYETLEKATDQKGFVIEKTLEQLQNTHYQQGFPQHALVSLKEVLKSFPKARLLITLVERDPAKYVGLKSYLEKNHKTQEVIFFSPYPEPLKFMRKENPFWPFAVATTDLSQALIMDSLFLETIARLDGDFIISPLDLMAHKKLFTPRLVQEFQRRKLKILLQEDPWPTHLEFEPQGVITSQPELFLNRISMESK